MEVSTFLLGAIATATMVMAAVQVGVIIYGARLARRVNRLVTLIEQDIQPMVKRMQSMSGDVARATSLAVAQVERADKIFSQAAGRLEHLMTIAQDALVEPARQGLALFQGLRAGLVALCGVANRQARQTEPMREDEDTLFIG